MSYQIIHQYTQSVIGYIDGLYLGNYTPEDMICYITRHRQLATLEK